MICNREIFWFLVGKCYKLAFLVETPLWKTSMPLRDTFETAKAPSQHWKNRRASKRHPSNTMTLTLKRLGTPNTRGVIIDPRVPFFTNIGNPKNERVQSGWTRGLSEIPQVELKSMIFGGSQKYEDMCEKVEVFANFRGLRTFKSCLVWRKLETLGILKCSGMFAAYHDVRLPDVLNDSDDEATLHPAACWQEMRRSHVDIRQPLSSPESLKIHDHPRA